MKAKIAAIKRAHELMCAQQDLTLEVAPRDSRFSPQLMELMKREESLLRDPAAPATKSVIQRVDEALRNETQQFFAKVVNQNVRKWENLRQNLQKEIQTLKKQITNRLRSEEMTPSSSGTAASSTIDVIAMEEERLMVDYYRNWYRYEMFHLQEAFSSQLARIDRDWGAHEQNLRNEYDTKRESITGRSSSPNPNSSSNTGDESGGASKWHHPEKQKTLIHTAPVFAPSSTVGSRGSSATKRDKTSASSTIELQRLDKEFQDALQQLQRQKADAKRWLHRQQLRLSAQCEEVRREKAVVADIIQSEQEEFHQMLSSIHGATTINAPSRGDDSNAAPVASGAGEREAQSEKNVRRLK